MTTQKIQQMAEAVRLFLRAFTVIGLLWMGLERLIYGEVQPRIVDNLISLAWSVMVWCAYYLGVKHGRRMPQNSPKNLGEDDGKTSF